MENFIYKQETHDIIGAAMAVHRYFGCGFTEKVYQDALEAVKELDNINRSQAINYATVAGYQIALLINFGTTSLEFERFAVSAKS